MSAEEVMTISGHLDFRSFKQYAKVTRAAQNNSNGGEWTFLMVFIDIF